MPRMLNHKSGCLWALWLLTWYQWTFAHAKILWKAEFLVTVVIMITTRQSSGRDVENPQSFCNPMAWIVARQFPSRLVLALTYSQLLKRSVHIKIHRNVQRNITCKPKAGNHLNELELMENKQMWVIHSELVFGKKRWGTRACYNMHKPQKCHAEGRKLETMLRGVRFQGHVVSRNRWIQGAEHTTVVSWCWEREFECCGDNEGYRI